MAAALAHAVSLQAGSHHADFHDHAWIILDDELRASRVRRARRSIPAGVDLPDVDGVPDPDRESEILASPVEPRSRALACGRLVRQD